MRKGNVVIKSLRITKSTYLLVIAITAAIAADSMVAVQFLGIAGQAVLFLLAFGSLSVATYAVSVDVFFRSRQTVDNLRSLGATRGSLSNSILLTVFIYALIGTVFGLVLGTGIGSALTNFGSASFSILLDATGLLIISIGAIAAGVYTGVGVAWRS